MGDTYPIHTVGQPLVGQACIAILLLDQRRYFFCGSGIEQWSARIATYAHHCMRPETAEYAEGLQYGGDELQGKGKVIKGELALDTTDPKSLDGKSRLGYFLHLHLALSTDKEYIYTVHELL